MGRRRKTPAVKRQHDVAGEAAADAGPARVDEGEAMSDNVELSQQNLQLESTQSVAETLGGHGAVDKPTSARADAADPQISPSSAQSHPIDSLSVRTVGDGEGPDVDGRDSSIPGSDDACVSTERIPVPATEAIHASESTSVGTATRAGKEPADLSARCVESATSEIGTGITIPIECDGGHNARAAEAVAEMTTVASSCGMGGPRPADAEEQRVRHRSRSAATPTVSPPALDVEAEGGKSAEDGSCLGSDVAAHSAQATSVAEAAGAAAASGSPVQSQGQNPLNGTVLPEGLTPSHHHSDPPASSHSPADTRVKQSRIDARSESAPPPPPTTDSSASHPSGVSPAKSHADNRVSHEETPGTAYATPRASDPEVTSALTFAPIAAQPPADTSKASAGANGDSKTLEARLLAAVSSPERAVEDRAGTLTETGTECDDSDDGQEARHRLVRPHSTALAHVRVHLVSETATEGEEYDSDIANLHPRKGGVNITAAAASAAASDSSSRRIRHSMTLPAGDADTVARMLSVASITPGRRGAKHGIGSPRHTPRAFATPRSQVPGSPPLSGRAASSRRGKRIKISRVADGAEADEIEVREDRKVLQVIPMDDVVGIRFDIFYEGQLKRSFVVPSRL